MLESDLFPPALHLIGAIELGEKFRQFHVVVRPTSQVSRAPCHLSGASDLFGCYAVSCFT